jgi:origin recognition complex subunit 4
LPSSSKNAPIVVKLSGLAQTNDRLAIREMGRQIAEAEGQKVVDDVPGGEHNEEEVSHVRFRLLS